MRSIIITFFVRHRIPVIGLICLAAALMIALPLSGFAWDGFDYETGNYIEIDDADIPVIAPGALMQIFDNEDSEYHPVEIIAVENASGETGIEVFDHDMNEFRTFEMEGVTIKHAK